MVRCQNSQSYMWTYPMQQHDINKKDRLQITSLTCVHILYNNTKTNIKIKDCLQNAQSYMCTYPLQQHKHKHKISLPKRPVLHVYISSTTTQT